jgi:hypothetical protein
LIPQKDPDKEGQQETEDPIPVEYIQDKAENDQYPDNEEDDVEHGGRPSPIGVVSITSRSFLLESRHDLTIHNRDRH